MPMALLKEKTASFSLVRHGGYKGPGGSALSLVDILIVGQQSRGRMEAMPEEVPRASSSVTWSASPAEVI